MFCSLRSLRTTGSDLPGQTAVPFIMRSNLPPKILKGKDRLSLCARGLYRSDHNPRKNFGRLHVVFFFFKTETETGTEHFNNKNVANPCNVQVFLFLFSLLLLPEMWDLSDANKNGALNQDGFDLLLRLIAQCQSGQVMPTLLAVCCFNTSGTLFGVYYCCYLPWYCFCHPYFVGVTIFPLGRGQWCISMLLLLVVPGTDLLIR